MAKHPTSTPAPTARPRQTIDDPRSRSQRPGDSDTTRSGQAAVAADPNAKKLPDGKDPRDPQYPGPLSTSENVTTDEQEAAQAARKEDITTADIGPYGTASRAEQIESQKAAAENPLSPQSTSISEPHTAVGGGVVNPPRPEGQQSPVPQGTGSPNSWKFDPMTGQPLAGNQAGPASARGTRRRLEDDKDEVEVNLKAGINLTDDHGTTHRYEAGKQKMPRAHADHWYVRQHEVKEDEDGAKASSKK